MAKIDSVLDLIRMRKQTLEKDKERAAHWRVRYIDESIESLNYILREGIEKNAHIFLSMSAYADKHFIDMSWGSPSDIVGMMKDIGTWEYKKNQNY